MATLLTTTLNVLLPSLCALCALPSHSRFPLCDACRADLIPNTHSCVRCALPLNAFSGHCLVCPDCQRTPPPFTRTIAPWVYDELLGHLIGRFKHSRQRQLAPMLASLWQQGIAAAGPDDRSAAAAVDVLVPVPLHWRRRWQRGFNQAELIARALPPQGKGAKVIPGMLRRSLHTAAQQGLTASQRRRNLGGAFTALQRCDNLHVAVVDDVMTTGATAATVANALLNAGAARVDLWCLARTPTPR